MKHSKHRFTVSKELLDKNIVSQLKTEDDVSRVIFYILTLIFYRIILYNFIINILLIAAAFLTNIS